ncbi:hypothetical protein [Streptomyces sp. NPDC050504]|uniref:hypothetical protein n=1 Tax=Streptomyces sp. NPDC050504 TaxID=3365618 RepID=UPI00378871E9
MTDQQCWYTSKPVMTGFMGGEIEMIGSWPGTVSGLVLTALSTAVVLWSWHVEEIRWKELAATADPVREPDEGVTFYEYAYLNHHYGTGNTLAVALVRMHTQRRLALVGKEHAKYYFEVNDPVPQDDIEAMVLDLLVQQKGSLASYICLIDRDRSPLQPMHRRLVADGLLRERGLPAGVPADSSQATAWRARRRAAHRLRGCLLGALVTLGGAVAVVSGAWPPLALHVTALLALAVWRVRSRPPEEWGTTDEGEAALRALWNAELDPEEAQTRLIARRGLDALPDHHPLALVPAPPPDRDEPREEPPPVINFDPPGLGGL